MTEMVYNIIMSQYSYSSFLILSALRSSTSFHTLNPRKCVPKVVLIQYNAQHMRNIK